MKYYNIEKMTIEIESFQRKLFFGNVNISSQQVFLIWSTFLTFLIAKSKSEKVSLETIKSRFVTGIEKRETLKNIIFFKREIGL